MCDPGLKYVDFRPSTCIIFIEEFVSICLYVELQNYTNSLSSDAFVISTFSALYW